MNQEKYTKMKEEYREKTNEELKAIVEGVAFYWGMDCADTTTPYQHGSAVSILEERNVPSKEIQELFDQAHFEGKCQRFGEFFYEEGSKEKHTISSLNKLFGEKVVQKALPSLLERDEIRMIGKDAVICLKEGVPMQKATK